MIQLTKVNRINVKPVNSLIYINTLSWFENNIQIVNNIKIPSYQLSPYHLHFIVNNNKIIFENYWQGCKIYKQVNTQKQVVANKVIWDHPAEIHIDNDNNITNNYWQWRNKLFCNPYVVRYPNGYYGRKKCVCAVDLDKDGNISYLDYITARKQLYIGAYAQLVQQTEAYKQLVILINNGINLCFTDIDVPENMIVNQINYDKYLNDNTRAFGHTWVLAACLLGLKLN